MSTEIAGRGMGTKVRISSTDAPIREYLESVEANTFGVDAAKQGTSPNTWWVKLAVADAVEEMLA